MSDVSECHRPCPECTGKWIVWWDEMASQPRVSHSDPACQWWLAHVILAQELAAGGTKEGT